MNNTNEPLQKTLWVPAISWISYDLANTIYAATVSYLLVPYYTKHFGSTSIGVTQMISMVLAGIWTTGRKVLLILAPSEKLGEFFGLYGITIKLSVIGCVSFGIVRDYVNTKAALLVQLIQLILGLVFLFSFCIKQDNFSGGNNVE